jgi:hypothetical protein
MTQSNLDIEDKVPEEDTSYDTSDKEAVNTARKKSSRTRADRLEFVKASMSFEQGRAWFYDLLVFCHVFETTFDEDPLRMAFKASRHNVGLRILDDIQTASPENYMTMIKENKSK